jgi:hypothetical protein
MNKTLATLILLVIFSACENQEWSFPDYDYTTVYFPYQYPIRTLVLGDDIFPNENDNNHTFHISAAMGGVYKNNVNRVINFELDESLCDSATFNSGGAIRVLPSEYYTLSSPDKITIPAGQFNGSVEVKLSEAFFADSLSIGVNYVIPLRLISTDDVDSILQGNPLAEVPDPRISSHWETTPKNFTIFAVRYINPYHGTYLLRGTDVVKDNSDNVLETIIYRKKYVEYDEIKKLETKSLHQVMYIGPVRKLSGSAGNFKALLNFSENGDCTISTADGSSFPVTGTGKFVEKGDEWGNQKRNVIHLDYQIQEGLRTHFVNDTLVIRDRGVKLEIFAPVISN